MRRYHKAGIHADIHNSFQVVSRPYIGKPLPKMPDALTLVFLEIRLANGVLYLLYGYQSDPVPMIEPNVRAYPVDDAVMSER